MEDSSRTATLTPGTPRRFCAASPIGLADASGAQPCIGSFGIGTGATDPVGETDGLDVTAAALSASFPRGLMVVQDDRNEGFSRNFKYVSWADVEAALGLPAD